MNFDSMDIIKAMQIIAESNTSKLKLDKTIVAQVVSIENIETGEYRVTYEGNIFPARSYDVKTTFVVGENVYVKIPENDMTNEKIIEGRVVTSGNTLSDIVEQQVEINTIEPSLDKFYGYNSSKSRGIIAGVPSNSPYFMQTIFQNHGNETADNIFRNYAANYGKIKISGSFYTKFIGSHNKGNYGLIVTFKTLQPNENGEMENATISYRLDFSNFVGDPYRYTSPSPQSIIIDVFKESVIGLDSIILFQENFDIDKSLNYNNEVIYENKGEDNPPIFNIFVQDIDIAFCEVIDLKDTSYYLTIAAPQGTVFTNAVTSLPLVARLKYKGSNILSESTCKVYWYKENLSVKNGGDLYDKNAGVRWERISQGDYIPSIEIKDKDVVTHAKYKLVVIYQDVCLTKEIEIRHLAMQHNIGIKQATKNNSRIVLQLKSNIQDDNREYKGEWYFYLPDGSYDLIPVKNGENLKRSEVDVTDYLIYPEATFYCQVYYQDTPICIEYHNFALSESADDLTITYVGQDIYQYNANGDVAYEDTEVDRTLGISVEWKDGVGSAYSIAYLASDGTELSTDRTKAYTADDSMMENLWVDSDSKLHYNIRQKYDVKRSNNTVIIKIKCAMNGNEYSFYKEIMFLKDGDQGTNGTTYFCVIRPVNLANGEKVEGFHALEYNGTWQGSGLNLRCYVYKNGMRINGNNQFELKYDWKCGSIDANKNDKLSIESTPGRLNFSDYKTIKGTGVLDTTGDYVVKVTITIRERANNEDTQIHYQYPIDIAVGGFRMQFLDMNLPSYIKYTASGINASFMNQELKCTYGGNTLPIFSTDETILQIKDWKLDPVQKFQYTGGIAALRCEVSKTVYLLHPVMMYLDTYGNEAINGWDGTKLDIDDDGRYILAPQVGAGKKNPDNTFTGVVMGQDTAEDKIGLYGYRVGIAQFGFKEDGTAFIGASGDGQILFNGNRGTITSGNYSDNTGMKIDLQNGHIDSYNFKISSGNMILDSANQRFDFTVGANSSSHFVIKHKDGTNLFYISDGNYYLQSQDYRSSSQGTRFDLTNGRIDSYNFNLRSSCLTINSSNNTFSFDVLGSSSSGRFSIRAGTSTLMNVSTNSYYLQSINYHYVNSDNITGVYINLQNGMFRVGGNAEFSGTIHATSGHIGGWSINQYGLSNDDGTVYIRSTGEAAFGKNLSISKGGILTATNAVLEGTVTATAGSIGKWIIQDGAITGGHTRLLSEGRIQTDYIDIFHSESRNILGRLGYMEGDNGVQKTICLALSTSDSRCSAIIESGLHMRLGAVGTIYIDGQDCNFRKTPIHSASSITTTGDISGKDVIGSGTIKGVNLEAITKLTAKTATINGSLSCQTITVTSGPVSLPGVKVTGTGGLVVESGGATIAGLLTANGGITAQGTVNFSGATSQQGIRAQFV